MKHLSEKSHCILYFFDKSSVLVTFNHRKSKDLQSPKYFLSYTRSSNLSLQDQSIKIAWDIYTETFSNGLMVYLASVWTARMSDLTSLSVRIIICESDSRGWLLCLVSCRSVPTCKNDVIASLAMHKATVYLLPTMIGEVNAQSQI